jgi:predicted HicB family RNase H-like nuclease
MSTKPRNTKSETLRVRVYPEVKTWLARHAAKSHLDISDIVRQIIMARYEGRTKGGAVTSGK